MKIPSLPSVISWFKQTVLPKTETPSPTASRPPVAQDSLAISGSARALGTAPKLSGSFLQLSGADNDKSLETWMLELGAMKRVGMDTAIIQYNQSGGSNFSVATENILTAADQLGMKITVGTALNEEGWYTNKFSKGFLEKEGQSVADYTRILVNQFKDHPSFTAVYIPYEENGMADPEDIGDFYGKIATAAKEEKPDLKVMISPYTNLLPGIAMSMPQKTIEDRFSRMLSRANVDILAWQDGVGGTQKQLNRVGHDIQAMQKACQANGVELWSDVEAFNRTTRLYEDFKAQPASMDTLKKQLTEQAPYVSKIVSFDFNHYMSPQGDEQSAKLYNDYEGYLKELDNP